MNENQIQARLYTRKYATTDSGMAAMNDFGTVRYQHQIIDLTRRVEPGRSVEYSDYSAEFTAIAACVRHDQRRNGYVIFVGGLPSPLMTPEILSQAKGGGYNPLLTDFNGCEAPGPTVPISLVK